jgi:hypothetical protein
MNSSKIGADRFIIAAGIFPRIGAFGSRGKFRSTVDIGRISAIR